MDTDRPNLIADPLARRSAWSAFRLPLLASLLAIAWFIGGGALGVATAVCCAIVSLAWNRQYGSATALGFLFLIATEFGIGSWVIVRLDTGDQCLMSWGIPVERRPMAEPYRTHLLSVATPELEGQWVWCAQEIGSNHSDRMVYSFYLSASAWATDEPAIAKIVISDLATYLRSTHATYGLPECYPMIWPDVVVRKSDGVTLTEEWQKNERVIDYLTRKGYLRQT